MKSLWDIKPNFRCSFEIGERIDVLSVKSIDYENDVMRRCDAHLSVCIDIVML